RNTRTSPRAIELVPLIHSPPVLLSPPFHPFPPLSSSPPRHPLPPLSSSSPVLLSLPCRPLSPVILSSPCLPPTLVFLSPALFSSLSTAILSPPSECAVQAAAGQRATMEGRTWAKPAATRAIRRVDAGHYGTLHSPCHLMRHSSTPPSFLLGPLQLATAAGVTAAA
ncbi:unnamed protein product, partial [Closterium sp. NIES-54]